MTLIAKGKVWALACEINVVHHCNLVCRACSHRAPQATPYFAEPDQVWRDLSSLAKIYHCRYVRLVGGEPLLHPALLEVVEAVSRSGVGEYVRIKTNGTLLSRMTDHFWAAVKEVHVSVYPGFEPNSPEVEGWKRKAAEHHAVLKLFPSHSFRECYSDRGTLNTRLVHQIYATCRPAHLWHCHTVSKGYIFKCPESWVLTGMLRSNEDLHNSRDGFPFDKSTALSELAAFFSSNEPLESCQYCLGSVGKSFGHGQAPRHSASAPRSTEELIDWKRLWQLRATLLPRTWLYRAERLLDSRRWRGHGV